MNARVLTLSLALAGAVPVFAAEPGIEFSGVLGVGKEVRVALTNTAKGSTHWVSLGGSFDGYVVSSYDAKNDVVVLTKDGREFRLALRQAKAPASKDAKPPAALERAVMNNLRQLAAAADQFYLENGKNSATYDDLVGPTKYVKQLSPVDGENYRAIQFMLGRDLTVTTASGHSFSYKP